MLNRTIPILFVLLLSACAESPYFPGKTASDVPSHVDTVYLKTIYITTAFGGESTKDPLAEPKQDTTPSDNDKEVLALAKANILSQLQNFGYAMTEDASHPADVVMGFYVSYIPERWPLIDRSVGIAGRLYALDGAPLLKMRADRNNNVGLIGALVGPSRDDMVAEAAREVAVKVVTEMRKGTLDKKGNKTAGTPVAANTASGRTEGQ